MAGQWTELFVKEIEKETCAFPLFFKGNRVKRDSLKETDAPFFRGRVQCMFAGCIKYSIFTKLHQKRVGYKSETPYLIPLYRNKTRETAAYELKTNVLSTAFYERLGHWQVHMYLHRNVLREIQPMWEVNRCFRKLPLKLQQ